ncbi:hypothetical protein DAPPUDRAFT_262816 [Daphnia pulex]|uniref:THAP-type domain-containing protein n=1 Tax=Daphnia pulex TaxID=6669 RepID=E9HNR1_DAPPU|nr:hypothetical protein DAPPUDRAFT_262816 [Daphnia pulex]|eukprot:EFX66625.1 hypothetical protein DAPPUDRAFT_262816 [Daphnia pulex]
MTIAGDVSFDPMKLVFEGFVDYGEDDGFSEPITLKKHEGELADHALVLIFRPYRYSWIQPIACYATKGACPGGVIHQLMARAITVLHQNGAIVKSVVCDGAQTNKTVMRLCSITVQRIAGTPLSGLHKLTESHLYPTSFEKMNILESLLEALWETELASDSTNLKPFASQTTFEALRVTVFSTIELTEHLFSSEINYEFVLTGKLNQDCIERFFGIIRQAGGGTETPTVHSFLALFRMLCVYYPTKTTIAHANVEEERMSLLTSYKDCMLNRFKKDKKEAKARKQALKDRLANGMSMIDGTVFNMSAYNKCIDDVVYYLAGYVLHSRRNLIGSCDECWKSLTTDEDLPENSSFPNWLIVLRDKGGLKKVTPNIHSFSIPSKVEEERGSVERNQSTTSVKKIIEIVNYSSRNRNAACGLFCETDSAEEELLKEKPIPNQAPTQASTPAEEQTAAATTELPGPIPRRSRRLLDSASESEPELILTADEEENVLKNLALSSIRQDKTVETLEEAAKKLDLVSEPMNH